jgi:hypothetical protein
MGFNRILLRFHGMLKGFYRDLMGFLLGDLVELTIW